MKEKVKGFLKKHKYVILGTLIGTGCVLIGYKAGQEVQLDRWSRTIAKMWELNPDLKPVMLNTFEEMGKPKPAK